jgi:hypothetical protein
MHRTFPILAFAATAFVATAATAASGPFNLVNATADSVVAVAIAPNGSDAFQAVDLGGPLVGGLNAMAFAMPDGPCQRDVQLTFRDGRTTRLSGIDVCRTHGLRLNGVRGRMITPDALAKQGL